MVLHGFWDISTFLVGTKDGISGAGLSVALGLMAVNALLAAVILLRRRTLLDPS